MGLLIDLGLDFETYYDGDYTLRSMMMTEYIFDPRFEVVGVSLKVGGGVPAKWYTGDRAYIASVLAKVPWHRCRAIAHNAFFDGGILEWIFGMRPGAYLCTMQGSRPFVAPYTGNVALATVAEYFKFGYKGNEVHAAKGKHRLEFTPEELEAYGAYCCHDTELAFKIGLHLKGILPAPEQELLDLTIKKFTRPRMTLDIDAVTARLADLAVKRKMIEAKAALVGGTATALRSRPKFAAILQKYNVTPPTKISKTTGEKTFAFAKDDEGFIELLTHDDVRVRTLVEAKLFMNSTQEESRLERFKTIYGLNIGGQHLLPAPLLYYGAHPGRFSGYDKINLQNLTRVKRDKVTKQLLAGHLRFALRAPEGYSIVAGDLSNIEARIVATLARCTSLVTAFREGRDIYCEFASRIYGRSITKADEVERFVGKTCILGLGYGMGASKFGMQMKIARVKMAMDMLRRVVYLYRDTYNDIPMLWAQLETLLLGMLDPKGLICWGPLTFAHQRIILPNGMPIVYNGLTRSKTTNELYYRSMRKGSGNDNKLWGGAITENIVQALARIIIADAEIRMAKFGVKAVLQVHDELVYCVRNEHVDAVKKALAIAMTVPVPWLPELPIACEIKHGPTYGDAK